MRNWMRGRVVGGQGNARDRAVFLLLPGAVFKIPRSFDA